VTSNKKAGSFEINWVTSDLGFPEMGRSRVVRPWEPEESGGEATVIEGPHNETFRLAEFAAALDLKKTETQFPDEKGGARGDCEGASGGGKVLGAEEHNEREGMCEPEAGCRKEIIGLDGGRGMQKGSRLSK